jgi:two-component system CheB/CheR fusion protein
MPLPTDLIRVVHQLATCRRLDDVVATLSSAARCLSGADGATVVLRDGDFVRYVDESAVAPLWKGRRFPIEQCVSGWSILHHEQVTIPDVYDDPRVPVAAYRPTFVRSLVMTPIRGEDPLGALGAYWSQRHEASEEEREILAALAESAAVAIVNARLIEDLEQAAARKDELLSMLAHELRSPLAPLRNALRVLDLRPDEESARQARAVMERQVEHLGRMVDDLIDVARLRLAKLDVCLERVDLRRVVDETLADRRAAVEHAGLALRSELPPDPLWVRADRMRLAQVLANLLDNAVKFTPGGGNVRLCVGREGCEAVLRLRDDGVGITEDLLPHVFDPFVQQRQPLAREGGGLGLGLTVARGIARLHEGSLQARSEGTGQGTELVLRLPLDAEPPALTALPAAEEVEQGPVRVLVIEDNVDSAESLRMLLELCGYQVSLAHDGPAALAIAEAVHPEVVLCDIGLPGMDGYAVASALRACPRLAAARLIAVTGYGLEEDRRRALAAGFDVHLVKPVAPDLLLGQLGGVRVARGSSRAS